jgi:phosphate:Na+ symporter
MFKTLSDIERIGDHAENIAEFTLIIKDSNLKFTDVALAELKLLGDLTIKQADRTIDTYGRQDESRLSEILSFEKEIDKLSIDFTENHIERLKNEKCEPKSGVIFTDIIINLERTADHAKNVATSITSKQSF